MLEDDNFIDASIYVAPRRNGLDSDEDSDTEEGCSANHLSSGQLNAPAEFVINYGSDVVNSLDSQVSDDSESNVEQPEMMEENNEQDNESDRSSSAIGNHLLAVHPPTAQQSWVSKDLPKAEFPNKPTTRQLTQPQTPTAIFNAFFTDEVIGHMVEMTNLYAVRDKGKHGFLTDIPEMRVFLAMLLLSGYSVLRRRKMYWVR